jgi:hypothetical protein
MKATRGVVIFDGAGVVTHDRRIGSRVDTPRGRCYNHNFGEKLALSLGML